MAVAQPVICDMKCEEKGDWGKEINAGDEEKTIHNK
jgi:hypothetical protein